MNHYLTFNGTRLFQIAFFSDAHGNVTGRFQHGARTEGATIPQDDKTECVVIREDGIVSFCEGCKFNSSAADGMEIFSGTVAHAHMSENPDKIRRAIRETDCGHA